MEADAGNGEEGGRIIVYGYPVFQLPKETSDLIDEARKEFPGLYAAFNYDEWDTIEQFTEDLRQRLTWARQMKAELEHHEVRFPTGTRPAKEGSTTRRKPEHEPNDQKEAMKALREGNLPELARIFRVRRGLSLKDILQEIIKEKL